MNEPGMDSPLVSAGDSVTHGGGQDAIAKRIRFVVVCFSAETCYLVDVRAGASRAARAAHRITAQADLVGSLGARGAAGAAVDKTGPSLLPVALGGPVVTHGAWKAAVAARVLFGAVCYLAETYDLFGVRPGAGPSD